MTLSLLIPMTLFGCPAAEEPPPGAPPGTTTEPTVPVTESIAY